MTQTLHCEGGWETQIIDKMLTISNQKGPKIRSCATAGIGNATVILSQPIPCSMCADLRWSSPAKLLIILQHPASRDFGRTVAFWSIYTSIDYSTRVLDLCAWHLHCISQGQHQVRGLILTCLLLLSIKLEFTLVSVESHPFARQLLQGIFRSAMSSFNGKESYPLVPLKWDVVHTNVTKALPSGSRFRYLLSQCERRIIPLVTALQNWLSSFMLDIKKCRRYNFPRSDGLSGAEKVTVVAERFSVMV